MKVPFVDLHAQYLAIKAEIDSAIAEVIGPSAFIRGKHVDAFEQAWAQTLKVKHCISCANGTDALYIAMRGLGIKAGDEVITTAHCGSQLRRRSRKREVGLSFATHKKGPSISIHA